MKPEVRQGIVCISQKGRDKGRAYVVLCELDADFLLLADGESRKLDRMKKKRRKHLLATPRELPGILALYQQGRLQDSDLKRQLSPQTLDQHAASKEDSVGQERSHRN